MVQIETSSVPCATSRPAVNSSESPGRKKPTSSPVSAKITSISTMIPAAARRSAESHSGIPGTAARTIPSAAPARVETGGSTRSGYLRARFPTWHARGWSWSVVTPRG